MSTAKQAEPWVIDHHRHAMIGGRYATVYERDGGRNDGLHGNNVARIYKLSAHCWQLRWGGPVSMVEDFDRLHHIPDYLREHWQEIVEGRKSR